MDSEQHNIIASSSTPGKRMLPLVKLTLVLLFIVGLIVFLKPQMGDARAAASKNQCRNNLKAIGLAIHDYIDKHNDIPKDQNGNFSLSELEKFHPGLTLKCPSSKDRNQTDYEFRPGLSLKDFTPAEGASRHVIAVEKVANHPCFKDNHFRILLMADCSVNEAVEEIDKPKTPNYPWDWKFKNTE